MLIVNLLKWIGYSLGRNLFEYKLFHSLLLRLERDWNFFFSTISYPKVPKDRDSISLCLHSGQHMSAFDKC